eukprot:TRINITY_DN6277_c0_g2_i2.p1 TRINITY_DN6277_c0_g2~~TRINITY_DN6277_c0_g2_i2.p1  ORF type:complete len:1153 (+),score=242.30 TRINITY_DN6277_c0_g2_i2:67-3459(+)
MQWGGSGGRDIRARCIPADEEGAASWHRRAPAAAAAAARSPPPAGAAGPAGWSDADPAWDSPGGPHTPADPGGWSERGSAGLPSPLFGSQYAGPCLSTEGSDSSPCSSICGVPEAGARWEPDKSRGQCAQCSEPFHLLRRRHHCRKCGLLVCDGCSRQRVKIPAKDRGEQVHRVCDTCATRTEVKLRGKVFRQHRQLARAHRELLEHKEQARRRSHTEEAEAVLSDMRAEMQRQLVAMLLRCPARRRGSSSAASRAPDWRLAAAAAAFADSAGQRYTGRHTLGEWCAALGDAFPISLRAARDAAEMVDAFRAAGLLTEHSDGAASTLGVTNPRYRWSGTALLELLRHAEDIRCTAPNPRPRFKSGDVVLWRNAERTVAHELSDGKLRLSAATPCGATAGESALAADVRPSPAADFIRALREGSSGEPNVARDLDEAPVPLHAVDTVLLRTALTSVEHAASIATVTQSRSPGTDSVPTFEVDQLREWLCGPPLVLGSIDADWLIKLMQNNLLLFSTCKRFFAKPRGLLCPPRVQALRAAVAAARARDDSLPVVRSAVGGPFAHSDSVVVAADALELIERRLIRIADVSSDNADSMLVAVAAHVSGREGQVLRVCSSDQSHADTFVEVRFAGLPLPNPVQVCELRPAALRRSPASMVAEGFSKKQFYCRGVAARGLPERGQKLDGVSTPLLHLANAFARAVLAGEIGEKRAVQGAQGADAVDWLERMYPSLQGHGTTFCALLRRWGLMHADSKAQGFDARSTYAVDPGMADRVAAEAATRLGPYASEFGFKAALRAARRQSTLRAPRPRAAARAVRGRSEAPREQPGPRHPRGAELPPAGGQRGERRPDHDPAARPTSSILRGGVGWSPETRSRRCQSMPATQRGERALDRPLSRVARSPSVGRASSCRRRTVLVPCPPSSRSASRSPSRAGSTQGDGAELPAPPEASKQPSETSGLLQRIASRLSAPPGTPGGTPGSPLHRGDVLDAVFLKRSDHLHQWRPRRFVCNPADGRLTYYEAQPKAKREIVLDPPDAHGAGLAGGGVLADGGAGSAVTKGTKLDALWTDHGRGQCLVRTARGMVGVAPIADLDWGELKCSVELMKTAPLPPRARPLAARTGRVRLGTATAVAPRR